MRYLFVEEAMVLCVLEYESAPPKIKTNANLWY